MWPFDDEEQLNEIDQEFFDVSNEIGEIAETQDAGLSALQDLYNEYDFGDDSKARDIFIEASDKVRKKFGDTQPYSYEETLNYAPVDFADIQVESTDPEEQKLELINKWEEENLKNLKETEDLSYLQAGSQLERGIRQAATIQRRELYGKDNYIVTDLALRFGQGAIGPIADLVGADSVTDFFTEQTDPDRDDSYWSAIASGAGSAAGAIGSGVVSGGWGTAGYLGASGAGAVRRQIEESLENEGTASEALAAGGLEAVNQAVQVGVGTKIFGSVASKIAGTTTAKLGERVYPRIVKDALLEGSTEGVGQIVSNVAENIGQDKDDDIFAGVKQAGVAGFVVGGAASGVGEYAVQRESNLAANMSPEVGQESGQSLEELNRVVTSLEGSPPPAAEAIPAGRRSVDVETTPIMNLENGFQIVESEQGVHLKGSEAPLQAYEQVKFVSPETADKLRQLTNSSSPDGTAVTLRLNENGDLVVSSLSAVSEDLTIDANQKQPNNRTIKTEDTADGNVPVFVSRRRTTNGVNQDPFMIAPGKVTNSSLSAARIGFGGQKTSEFIKRKIEKYGPDISEEVGLTGETFVELEDGTTVRTQIPLKTYFPASQLKRGEQAADYLSQNGVWKTMERLNASDRFNAEDQALAANLVNMFEQGKRDAIKKRDRISYIQLNELLGEALDLQTKVKAVFGEGLGLGTDAAIARTTGQTPGSLRASLIESELERQAYEEYLKENKEQLNLPQLLAESDAAEAEMKANAPKENKSDEGQVTYEFSTPEAQEKYNKAKEKFEKTAEKLKKGEQKVLDRLAKLTPEDRQSLITLGDLLSTIKEPTMKVAVASKIFDIESKLITKDSSPEAFNRIYNFFRGNILSGFSTQERNFVGNASSALSNVLGLAGSGNLREAGLYAKEWIKSTPASIRSGTEILKGTREGRFKFGEKIVDAEGNAKNLNRVAPLNNPVRLLMEGKPGDAAVAGLTFIQNAMYRLLNFQDVVFYKNANSAMSYLAEYAANKNISDPKERRAAVEQALYGSTKFKEDTLARLNSQRDALKSAGVDLTDAQIREAFGEAMEENRSKRTREIANQHAEKSIFVNDPTGSMGAFYNGIEKVMEDWSFDMAGTRVKPFKFLMPFTRVASNVTSHIMEFVPGIGHAKALKNDPNAPTSAFNHGLTEIDAKMVLGRANAGMLMMAAAFGLAYEYKDEEKPFIEFYGYPPKGKWKQWKEQGIDSFSMRIGDTVFPLQGTSLAIIPAIVGGSMESIKSGADPVKVAATASLAAMGAVSTMSFLKPAGELFEFILGNKDQITADTGSAKKKFDNFWKSEADLLISGFIPASGFFNNIGRWMNESPTESYNNLAAKVAGDLPFAREAGIGKPQLNKFGDPITLTLGQRLTSGLGFHTIKTDPVFLWMQETGYDVTDQGPVLRLTTKKEKTFFADSQKELTGGYADVLTEEQSREVLELSGPEIKSFLKEIMNEPDFQVKSEAGQKYIDQYVNKVRARAKLEVLSKSAKD